jgi:hypothetical protein
MFNISMRMKTDLSFWCATNHPTEVPTVGVAILTEESDKRPLNVRAAISEDCDCISYTTRKSSLRMQGAIA